MEVHALQLLITEQDLSFLATKVVQRDQVSDLCIRVTPEAIVVAGTYQMLMRVPFETFWSVSIQSAKVAITLADMKVVGFGAGLFKGVLLRMIGDEAAKEPGIQVEEDTILVDVDIFLSREGLQARTNLTSVRCQVGSLVIEAGEGR